jgi:hypothetical protein
MSAWLQLLSAIALQFKALARSFTPWSTVPERHFIIEAIASTVALTVRLTARNVKTNPRRQPFVAQTFAFELLYGLVILRYA